MTLLPSCLFSCPKCGLNFLSDSFPQDCDLLGVAWPFSVFGNTLAIVPSKERNDVLIGCTVLGEVTVRFSMDSGGLKEAFNNHKACDYYHVLLCSKLLYTVRNKGVTCPDMIPTNADNFLHNSIKNLPNKIYLGLCAWGCSSLSFSNLFLGGLRHTMNGKYCALSLSLSSFLMTLSRWTHCW